MEQDGEEAAPRGEETPRDGARSSPAPTAAPSSTHTCRQTWDSVASQPSSPGIATSALINRSTRGSKP